MGKYMGIRVPHWMLVKGLCGTSMQVCWGTAIPAVRMIIDI
jgi:hypothetical protein